jgi:hypothetical protein
MRQRFMKLRDGTEVTDRRFGRLRSFDDRSKFFPIRTLIREQAPLVTNSWAIDQLLDQGLEGACVGFAMGHELIAQPMHQPDITDTYVRERLYWEAQRIDEWPGGAYPGADPFGEGTSVLAGAKAAQAAGHYPEYRWAFSLDEALQALSHAGPAVIGCNWYEGCVEPDSEGYIHVSGSLVGGHAIAVNGIDVERKFVTLTNSWGPAWGQGGTCKLSWADLGRLLAEQGEFCVPVQRERVAL